MTSNFWTSRSSTWRFARFAVLALVAFVALQEFVGVWIAASTGLAAATLLLIDDVRSHRGEGTDGASSAPA